MRRKGFEPIIAALLLIIITIIAAAALYLWSSGLTTGAATGTAKFAFQIEVYDATYAYNSTAGTGTLTVSAILRNTGNTPITIADVKVRDLTKATSYASVSGGDATVTIGTSSLPYTLNPGEVKDVTITLTISAAWAGNAEAGDKFEILFIFSDGSTYSVIIQTHT